MSNVVRVLGIVAASMLLGLVGLSLALFTICDGLASSEGTGVLAICLALMAGAIAAIVWLGRGLSASRSAGRGLAVAPSAAASGPNLAPAVPTPVVAARPFTGTDLQVLIGLRVALVVLILLSLGGLALNAASFSRYGSSIAIQLILRNILGLLPPAAVLVALSVRNPPARVALDAAAGLGIASIVFRFGFLAFSFSGLFSSGFNEIPGLPMLLVRMALYSVLEAGATGLALYLRSRLGPWHAGGLIVAVLAFLLWDGLLQGAMQVLMTLAQ
jgi:hypothetical protein